MSLTQSATPKMVFLRRGFSTLLLWGIVATAFLSMQAWAYLGLIATLVLLSVIEYSSMLKKAQVSHAAFLLIVISLAYVLTVSIFFLKGYHDIPAGIDLIAICALIMGAFTFQLRKPVQGIEPLVSVSATILGFIYIPFLFYFAARIVFLPNEQGQVPGAFLLLWLIAVTKFTDMGAYITGSLCGKHKMIPHVSPGKTWEGFIGALLFAQLAGCGLFALFNEHLTLLKCWGDVVALGFVLAIAAVIGDLAESLVKRSLKIKDSGAFLPGIGGALDLIDSICFTAPILYFYLVFRV